MSETNNTKTQSPYDQRAHHYLERGYSVIPIAPGTKRPGNWTQENGWRGMHDWERFSRELPTEIHIKHWCNWPDAGIGLLCGKLSQIVALDRDWDCPGSDALEQIIPVSPVKKKGAKGYTAFFRYNGERSCSFNINGMRVMDVLSDGRQTLMPGTRHPEGMTYVYLTEDILEDYKPEELPQLPDDFLDQVAKVLAPYQTDEDKKYQKKNIVVVEKGETINTELTIQQQYFRDINRVALDNLDAWVPKLIPTAQPTSTGYRAIATWRGGKNPNVGINPDGIRDWKEGAGFTPIDLVRHTHQSTFAQAVAALRDCLPFQEPEPIVFGAVATPTATTNTPPVLPWLKPAKVEPPAPVMVPSESSIEPEPAVPAFILNPPGILGDIARWITATAPKEQPELSVAAAISLCSVVMGRTYKSQFNNFTSLYVIMVAKSTEGKEHPQSAIEKILTAADLGQLLGGSGYTSAPGVHTALLKAPAHIVLIDEMGKLLKLSRSKGNTHSEAALDKLVEAFGRLDGVMRPPTYSTMSMPQQKAEEMQKATDRLVHSPAITLLGATTPGTFFDNLSNDMVKDGFLGRCIVIESKRPRQLTRFVKRTTPPKKIIDWCKAVHVSSAASGNLAGLSIAEMPPTLIDLELSEECVPILATLDALMNDAKDSAEIDGLDMLLGRTVEKSMRLSMIVAKARDKDAREVRAADLEWAIDFVRHYDLALINSVREKRFENEHHQNANKVLDFIKRAKSMAKSTKNPVYAKFLKEGAMPHSLLLQRMNMESKRLIAIIETLQESNQITKYGEAELGIAFKGSVYRLCD
jgi:hypothetical protein